jgi:Flp pilus assembly protein TadG
MARNLFRSSARRGAAVLEAALVLPLLLLLSFGLVEFGYYFHVRHCLQGAAREGVRAAIPNSATNADVQAAVDRAMSAANLSSSGYRITVQPLDVHAAAEGTELTVSVECDWGNVGVRPLKLIAADRKLVGAVVMRKEGI